MNEIVEEAEDQIEEGLEEGIQEALEDTNEGFVNMETEESNFAGDTEGTSGSTPEDYQFQYPEGLTEDHLGQEFMDEFRTKLWESGKTNEEAQRELNNHLYFNAHMERRKAQMMNDTFLRWKRDSVTNGANNRAVQNKANEGLSMLDPTGEIRHYLGAHGLHNAFAIVRAFEAYAILNSQDGGTMRRGTNPGFTRRTPDQEANEWVDSS